MSDHPDKKSIFERLMPSLDINEVTEINEIELVSDSKQGSAKKAIKLLTELNEGYIEPNKTERTNLLIAYAKQNKVIYGKAFDIVKIPSRDNINLENLEEVEKNINKIIICEIKSTTKKGIGQCFEKYFFGLTTAELLVAQNLKNQFMFVFVNIQTKGVLELSLKQIFEKAKGIYPVWSIQF